MTDAVIVKERAGGKYTQDVNTTNHQSRRHQAWTGKHIRSPCPLLLDGPARLLPQRDAI